MQAPEQPLDLERRSQGFERRLRAKIAAHEVDRPIKIALQCDKDRRSAGARIRVRRHDELGVRGDLTPACPVSVFAPPHRAALGIQRVGEHIGVVDRGSGIQILRGLISMAQDALPCELIRADSALIA